MLLKTLLVVAVAVVSCARSPAWDRAPDPGRRRERDWRRRDDPGPNEKRVKIFLYPTEDYLEDRFLKRPRQQQYQPNSRFHAVEDDWRHRGDMWYYPTRAPRIQVGRGRYRLLGRSNAAELQCDFPEEDHQVISNIVWTRSDLTYNDLQDMSRLDAERPDHYATVTNDGQCSTLYLNHVTALDLGSYRCMATARGAHDGLIFTIFQDTEFYPELV